MEEVKKEAPPADDFDFNYGDEEEDNEEDAAGNAFFSIDTVSFDSDIVLCSMISCQGAS